MTRAPEVIFLYGPPFSGKSTLGSLLAAALNMQFHDLDCIVESVAGYSIKDIFTRDGEARFRDRERQALSDLLTNPWASCYSPCSTTDGAVIALGGGTLINPETRLLVEEHGRVLFLHTSTASLVSRLIKCSSITGRPLLNERNPIESLHELLSQRAAHYASFRLRLDTTDLDPTAAAWQAQIRLGNFRMQSMDQPCNIRVWRGGLHQIGMAAKKQDAHGSYALVSDNHVGSRYATVIQSSFEQVGIPIHYVEIPAGEENKNVTNVERIWESCLHSGLDRQGTLVALGGGVVGDLTGFAAATYLRGIPWINLPTTLLAMADACLGGKTGANLRQGKNLVGAFHTPSLILADPETLLTLPPRELVSGMAEILKHAIISDPQLFYLCISPACTAALVHPSDHLDLLDEMITRAMAVKIAIVEEDPFEQGRRAVLNLGHTVGHAIELVSGFQLRHGEAIGIGMVVEARLAAALGLTEEDLAKNIARILARWNLPSHLPPHLDCAAVLRAIQVDKKRQGEQIYFTLPQAIGKVITGIKVDKALIAKLLIDDDREASATL